MAQEVKNSSYMVSNSHITLGSNLRPLALQAKTHNHCSNNLYTTAKDEKNNSHCLSLVIFGGVKCIYSPALSLFFFKVINIYL